MLINKDLNLILESFLKTTRLHGRKAPAMAFVMTPEGKINQCSGRPNMPATESLRYLETGLFTLVREGKCRALGIPNGAGIFLEHQDGGAYRVELPDLNAASVLISLDRMVPVIAEPRFFVRSRFAQAR